MFPLPLACSPRRRASGFTLVEIMVGMVIGMLGLIIMMQVFSLSESQKRTTTGGGDAQSSGAIALFGLQRDLRQAGYGLTDPRLLGCNLLLPSSGATLSALAPVTINPLNSQGQIITGDPGTDTLLVVYGNGNGSPQGDVITTQPGLAMYAVATATSFNTNDQVIAIPSSRAVAPTFPCSLVLDSVTSVTAPNVSVATGVAGMPGGTLFNLGQAPKIHAYAIRNGNLTECDYMVNDCGNAANNTDPTKWVPIANNIASLKAQYGRDTMFGLTPTNTTMDGIVDWYDDTTPVAPPAAQPSPPMATGLPGPTYQCAFARISAVRLALVARNANFEKTVVVATVPTYVTPAEPTWEGSVAHTPPNPPTASDSIGWAADPIDLSANTGLTPPATWQNYRYKVIQMVVPLLNITWQGVPTGC